VDFQDQCIQPLCHPPGAIRERQSNAPRSGKALGSCEHGQPASADVPTRRSPVFTRVRLLVVARPPVPRGALDGRIGGRGEIAQLVEHSTENRGVGGSSPPLAIAWLGAGSCERGRLNELMTVLLPSAVGESAVGVFPMPLLSAPKRRSSPLSSFPQRPLPRCGARSSSSDCSRLRSLEGGCPTTASRRAAGSASLTHLTLLRCRNEA
jgi:hypothetical protein